MSTMKQKEKAVKPKKFVTEVSLVFEGYTVSSPWYHPKLAPVMCALCGKGCKEIRCVNVNPYCG